MSICSLMSQSPFNAGGRNCTCWTAVSGLGPYTAKASHALGIDAPRWRGVDSETLLREVWLVIRLHSSTHVVRAVVRVTIVLQVAFPFQAENALLGPDHRMASLRGVSIL